MANPAKIINTLSIAKPVVKAADELPVTGSYRAGGIKPQKPKKVKQSFEIANTREAKKKFKEDHWKEIEENGWSVDGLGYDIKVGGEPRQLRHKGKEKSNPANWSFDRTKQIRKAEAARKSTGADKGSFTKEQEENIYAFAKRNGYPEEGVGSAPWFIQGVKDADKALKSQNSAINRQLKTAATVGNFNSVDSEYLIMLRDMGYDINSFTKADLKRIQATGGHIVAAKETPQGANPQLPSNLQREPGFYNYSKQHKEDINTKVLRALGVSVGPQNYLEEFAKAADSEIGGFWLPKYGEFYTATQKDRINDVVMFHYNQRLPKDWDRNIINEDVLTDCINDVIGALLGKPLADR